MKKIFLSLSVAMVFAAYVVFERANSSFPSVASLFSEGTDNGSGLVVPPANILPSDNSTPGETLNPNPAPTPKPAPKPTPKPTPAPEPVPVPVTPPAQLGQYKDGSYTGKSVYAYYGNVQVKAIIQGGKLADVQFLDYPHDRSTSVYINSQATGYLKDEAIQAQSANVDTISGATYTSGGFRSSLADALAKAKN